MADAAEEATFVAVVDAVRAGCVEEPQLEFDPRVITCPACGVLPSHAGRRRDGRLPQLLRRGPHAREDVRALIRSEESISAERARSHRLAARLVTQAGATFTNTLVSLWSAVAFGGAWMGLRFLLSRRHSALEALVPLGLTLFALGTARLAVASRKALRVLVLGFAARPPPSQGAPCICRRCGAPLRRSRRVARVVSWCIYCRTTNVLVTLPRSSASCETRPEQGGGVRTRAGPPRAAICRPSVGRDSRDQRGDDRTRPRCVSAGRGFQTACIPSLPSWHIHAPATPG